MAHNLTAIVFLKILLTFHLVASTSYLGSGESCSRPCPRSTSPITFFGQNSLRNLPRYVEEVGPPYRPLIIDEVSGKLKVSVREASPADRYRNLLFLTFYQTQAGVVKIGLRTLPRFATTRESYWFTVNNGQYGQSPMISLKREGSIDTIEGCCDASSLLMNIQGHSSLTEATLTGKNGAALSHGQTTVAWDPQATFTDSRWRLFPETSFFRSEESILTTQDSSASSAEQLPSVGIPGIQGGNAGIKDVVETPGKPENPTAQVGILAFPTRGKTTITKIQRKIKTNLIDMKKFKLSGVLGNRAAQSVCTTEQNTQVVLLLKSYKVAFSRNEKFKNEQVAVTIQNKHTLDFLGMDVDNNFKLKTQQKSMKIKGKSIRVDVSKLILVTKDIEKETSSSIQTVSAYTAKKAPTSRFGTKNYKAASPPKADPNSSPDQRFFVKRYLNSNKNRFVLCSLHHQDACIVEINKEYYLRVFKIPQVETPTPRPNPFCLRRPRQPKKPKFSIFAFSKARDYGKKYLQYLKDMKRYTAICIRSKKRVIPIEKGESTFQTVADSVLETGGLTFFNIQDLSCKEPKDFGRSPINLGKKAFPIKEVKLAR